MRVRGASQAGLGDVDRVVTVLVMRCSSVPSSSWSRVNGERGPSVVRRILNGLRVDLWLFWT